MNTDDFEGHTPAPWIIAWWEGQWYIDDENNDTVCELFGTAQKQDPTAKLIAAAPDLLQALIDERAEVKRLKGLSNALWNHICLIGGDMSDATDIWNEWSEEE